jgi:dihydrofolate reductase
MIVSLIVALSENRVIGRNQKLPWHLPEDLKRFKRITTGHPVIMGRKTYESIGRLLPGRENVIVSRNPNFRVDGAVMAASVEDALKRFERGDQEVFILGGGEIFSQTISCADRIYMTLVHDEIEGDVVFPEFDETKFEKKFVQKCSGSPAYTFIDFEKKHTEFV